MATIAQALPRGAARRIVVPAIELDERVHHEDHVLFWQVAGSAHVALPDETYELSEGRAVWVPVHVPHRIQLHEDSVMLPVFFAVDATATTLSRARQVAVESHLQTLLLALIQAQSTLLVPAINLERRVLPLIEETPTVAGGPAAPTSPAAAEVAEALAFDPGDTRSVAELAQSVHVSERTLERAFLAETGMPLQQWRRCVRMEAAATLLRSGAPTSAVAHRVGYGNLSAFHRAFAAHFGTTPGRYAAA